MSKARVDVHHHVLPDFYIEVQKRAGITGTAYQAFPQWSPEASLQIMDAHGIATAILSFTSPGIFFGDVGQTRELAVQFNDYLASLQRAEPNRFGGFAMLPLPDVDAAVKEIGRVQDDLGLDGICLLTSVDERYIGHPDFEAVYAELDRRRCIVFIHPCYPPGTEARGWDLPRMLIDYPFETTRVAANLVLNGVTTRYPNIRFILSHAGGTLPMLAHRISIFDRMPRFQEACPEGALAHLARFYYDTALSGHAGPLDLLLKFVPPSQVLFGTDYPYVVPAVVSAETAGFDAYAGFGAARQDVERGNAERLFPRLARCS